MNKYYIKINEADKIVLTSRKQMDGSFEITTAYDLINNDPSVEFYYTDGKVVTKENEMFVKNKRDRDKKVKIGRTEITSNIGNTFKCTAEFNTNIIIALEVMRLNSYSTVVLLDADTQPVTVTYTELINIATQLSQTILGLHADITADSVYKK